MDSDEVDDKQLDILDCNCVKTVKRLRASSWKNSVLIKDRKFRCQYQNNLPAVHIYIQGASGIAARFLIQI